MLLLSGEKLFSVRHAMSELNRSGAAVRIVTTSPPRMPRYSQSILRRAANFTGSVLANLPGTALLLGSIKP
jgi:hypothetical protein